MYKYTESGLKNVWLENGYVERDGAVAIEDSEGLHKAIGRNLARQPHLSGPEFRFLRKELGLSQVRIGGLLKASEETVSLWERHGRVPQSSARIVQAMYLETIDGDVRFGKLIEMLAELDNKRAERMVFREAEGSGWLESDKTKAVA